MPNPVGESLLNRGKRINRYGNTPDATAKILPTCKIVFVGNQLDLTKESLEVCGNAHPRYMIAQL